MIRIVQITVRVPHNYVYIDTNDAKYADKYLSGLISDPTFQNNVFTRTMMVPWKKLYIFPFEKSQLCNWLLGLVTWEAMNLIGSLAGMNIFNIAPYNYVI